MSHRGSETVAEQLARLEARHEAVLVLLRQILEVVQRMAGQPMRPDAS